MNQNAVSQPGAFCTAYAPMLPLLNTGGLTPDEVLSVRAHVSGCAWCQAKLAEYDMLFGALKRQYSPDSLNADTPRASDIAQLNIRRSMPAPAPLVAPNRPIVRLLHRASLRAEVAAALLVVALLGLLLGWERSVQLGGQTPLDPQAQAYLSTLHADYPRVLDALGVDYRQCILVFTSAPSADKPRDMLACRPKEATVMSASQTLLKDLANTPPPSRWETADSQLQNWARALIRAFGDRIVAIDAHDVSRFADLADSEVTPATNLSCTPIEQIDADLPAASQLPASASGACG